MTDLISKKELSAQMTYKCLWPYNECMLAAVHNFGEMRAALDRAEAKMRHLAECVQADERSIKTSIDFTKDYINMDDAIIVRLSWTMQGMLSPDEVIDEAIRRRFGK